MRKLCLNYPTFNAFLLSRRASTTQLVLRHVQHHVGRLARFLERRAGALDWTDRDATRRSAHAALLLLLAAVLVPTRVLVGVCAFVWLAWDATPVVVGRRATACVQLYWRRRAAGNAAVGTSK